MKKIVGPIGLLPKKNSDDFYSNRLKRVNLSTHIINFILFFFKNKITTVEKENNKIERLSLLWWGGGGVATGE